MQCPKCDRTMRTIDYESVEIETCDRCEGEWLDHDELFKITVIRDKKFDAEHQDAIVRTTTIASVPLEDVDRVILCPKCGVDLDPRSYGGSSSIYIDRCSKCEGIWLDDAEIEKIQMLVEGWERELPEDLAKYGGRLKYIDVEIDAADDVSVSRLPIIGRFINAMVNGILDSR